MQLLKTVYPADLLGTEQMFQDAIKVAKLDYAVYRLTVYTYSSTTFYDVNDVLEQKGGFCILRGHNPSCYISFFQSLT